MFVRTLVAGSALFASAAFANGSQQGQDEHYGVNLEDLRAKCAELSANDQLKPIKATVTCNELSSVWVAGQSKPAQLENSRNVGARVIMKGFEVQQRFYPAQQEATQIACQQFVKVERKVDNIDVEMACAELNAIQDLGEFCKPVIEARVGEDPSLRTERQTDEVLSVCPTAVR